MKTGYEVTYSDFMRLLSDPEDRRVVAPLIRKWFDCDVVATKSGFILRDSRGVELNPLDIHQAIQSDSSRQYDLYQTAMSLWR
jgi:hypothetical protein